MFVHLLLPSIGSLHSSCARACARRSLCWWIGFRAHGPQGCALALFLAACCALFGVPLLGIFGKDNSKRVRVPGGTPARTKAPRPEGELPEGELPEVEVQPFPSESVESELHELRERLAVEKKRTANLRTHLASEGYSPADIEAVADTGARQDFELGRTAREAKWIKTVAGWLKEHGWDTAGLGQSKLPNCYLLLLYRPKQEGGFRMTPRTKPKNVLAWECSGFEWRIYVGAEGNEPRPYRLNLKNGAPLGGHAPQCVKDWCAEGFEYLDDISLHDCPAGLEDALTLLLTMAFEKCGQGDWVQPAPWNPHGHFLMAIQNLAHLRLR